MTAAERETLKTLLDLINPIHCEIFRQTYNAPAARAYNVTVTAQMERDLTRAVLILENRLEGELDALAEAKAGGQ